MKAKKDVLKGLKPERVWHWFGEIMQIPRPSKHEERISKWLVQWGKDHGLETKSDKLGNVLIRKPASKGYEKSPWVALQAHMDMVCEKNSTKKFDFMKDAIQPVLDGGWLTADGTTLGADDGIGVATILAILEDKKLQHPALEALITVDEETGLTGANGLSKSWLKSEVLLNFDDEDEGEYCIGCAGGIDTVAEMDYKLVAAPKGCKAFIVKVSGLVGGHSGDDINRGRAAMVFEFRSTEPDMEFELRDAEMPKKVVDTDTQERLVNLVYACAHGVLAMSREIENFVETSTNLASIKMDKGFFRIATSQRSSVESAKLAAAAKLEATFRLAGCRVKHSDGYPGWTPNPDSRVLKVGVDVYKKMYGKEPVVRAIHAGLECGLIGEKYPQMDMISYGPTLRGVHSPDERIEIKTVEMFWNQTLEILKKLK